MFGVNVTDKMTDKCPKCGGHTIQKALFTSFYQHCEACENTTTQHIVNNPIAIGDTVAYKGGVWIVIDIPDKKTAKISHIHICTVEHVPIEKLIVYTFYI